ncbi:MAG: hypothetical protein AMJ88_16790 [Anaerolineae bacterium SM23_ 63]|nr:MAG: hypothetical protein AMJ88_16790 [Anaerolineae bacterium SM23_ 63]
MTIRVVGFIRDTSTEKLVGTEYYRCFLPMREVNSNDNQIEAIVLDGKRVLEAEAEQEQAGEWPHFDIFHWPRISPGDCEDFVNEVHNRGGLFLIDADDDLTEEFKLVSGRGEEFKNVLRNVDYLTVSTQALADRLTKYTKRPPVVLKNYIDVDWFGEKADAARRIIDGVTIGFSGSPTHWRDWYIPAVPFQRIVRNFDVEPILHGETPRYMKFVSENIVTLPGVPFFFYPTLLSQFDILLCSVDPDDPFNTGKSAIKAIEAMSVGAVPICSPFNPYIELLELGAPIIVVEEQTRDAWYEAMASLLKDDDYRLYLKSKGRDWVRQNRDMSTIGYKFWENFYKEITK